MKKSKSVFNVSGVASHAGFELSVARRGPVLEEKSFFTPQHVHLDPQSKSKREKIQRKIVEMVYILALIATVALMAPYPTIAGMTAMGYAVLSLLLNIIPSGNIIIQKFRGIPTWQWHGAEHKAGRMIELGLKPTMPIIKQTDKTHPRCGSAELGFKFFTALIWGVTGYILFVGAASFWILGLALLLCAFLLCIGVRLLDDLTNKSIGRGYQKIVTTQEPTEEQLKESLVLIEKVYQDFGYTPKEA